MRLLRRHEVQERIGLRSSALYALMQKGDFPKPVRIGTKAVAWPELEVDQWVEARISERNAAAARKKSRPKSATDGRTS